jgi:hypothetical protein
MATLHAPNAARQSVIVAACGAWGAVGVPQHCRAKEQKCSGTLSSVEEKW